MDILLLSGLLRLILRGLWAQELFMGHLNRASAKAMALQK